MAQLDYYRKAEWQAESNRAQCTSDGHIHALMAK
jgi:hypothetical protein